MASRCILSDTECLRYNLCFCGRHLGTLTVL
jgi:hypothetical protein